MSIAEGQSIGNYTVLSRLGVGGMGAVYLAEHPLIGKKVALKVIHGELAANKEVVQRFFNEARAVNKIGNEHVVEIHDFGQSPQGEYFYIMEYLEGRTLADVLVREGALLTQRALHIAAQIASALAAAHTCGIIHRDLKPDNIMLLERLGDRDFVKVLDFGLAKMIHDGASAKLTAAGVVLGTPQYMSPEACESKRDIDHRSDIYCLGILLFQMVCGRVPFEGQSMGEILVKHVSQAPPAARAINPQVPPAVEQIILRCLAKRPDDRFPTMKAMRDALLDADAYLASGPPVMPAAAVLGPQEKTMFPGAVNAQQLVQHMAQQAQPPAPGRGLPLPAPPPSMVAKPGAGAQAMAGVTASASAKTQFIGHPPHQPVGHAGHAAPAAAGPATAAALKTAYMEQPPPQGPAPGAPQQAAGGAAKTAFMDPSQAAALRPPEAPAMEMRRTSTAVPQMAPPAQAVNMTMVIGTPEGYSDKPPTKAWPIVVALIAVLLVAGGGVAAFAWPGFLVSKDDEAAAAEPPEEPSVTPVVDAGTAPPPQPPQPPAPKMAVIKLSTIPPGAEVFDTKGKALCAPTPCDVTFPIGTTHDLVFKHPKAVERKKTVDATGDTSLQIEMQPIEEKKRGGSSKPRGGSSGGKTKPPGGGKTKPPPDLMDDIVRPRLDD